jgi:ATP-binding cassette subfamily B (MDR/TAP) protein 1
MSVISGLVFGFYWGWKMALILFAASPALLLMAIVFAVLMSWNKEASMRVYANADGYATQAISGIKIVHTYGQELLEMKNYGKYQV